MVQRIKTGMIADDAVTAAKLDDSTSQLFGFRNRLHNGNFVISQRGSSTADMGVDSRGAGDRWFQWASAGGQSGRTTFSIETSDLPTGFTNGLKIQVTTTETPGATEAYALNQRIEGLNAQDLAWGTASAKSLTLSFWAKTTKAGTYCVYLNNSSASTKYNIREVSLTTSWAYYTLTFSGDTSTAITNDNLGRLQVYFGLTAGSTVASGTAGDNWNTGYGFTSNQVNFFDSTDNILRVTGVQLEVGTVATPFEHRPYGMELQLCQRYYYRTTQYGTFSPVGVGRAWSSTTGNAPFFLPVPMRANQTISYSSLSDFDIVTIGSPTSIGNDGSGPNNVKIGWGKSTGVSSGALYQFEFGNNLNAWLAFSAEI
jgi:hypothetical protein